jgi:hypothetical protein
MSEDQPGHLDLTVLEGAPSDAADVLLHFEPLPIEGCGWPAGSCRKAAAMRPRNGTPR